MGAAQLSEVDDRKYRDALAAAGYTGSRGAVLFCLMLAVVGAGLGSVVLAIILMATVPGIGEAKSTLIGALVGAVLLAAVGLVKIHRGNLEAREIVEDKEWRRQLLRRHGDSAP